MNHPLTLFQTQINQFAQQNNISYLGLFGSYARNEQKHDSDVDLLVNFDKKISLLDLVDTENKLGNLFKKKVDLIPDGSINKYVKPYVEKDIITIYGQR